MGLAPSSAAQLHVHREGQAADADFVPLQNIA